MWDVSWTFSEASSFLSVFTGVIVRTHTQLDIETKGGFSHGRICSRCRGRAVGLVNFQMLFLRAAWMSESNTFLISFDACPFALGRLSAFENGKNDSQ